MSQDLFAAFGEEDVGLIWKDEVSFQQKPTGNPFEAWSPDQTSGWHETNDTGLSNVPDDDDDFGDFEDASASRAANGTANTGASATDATRSPKSKQPTAPERTLQSKATTKPVTNVYPTSPPLKQQEVGHHPFAGHMDLLFEAADDEYDAGADELADLATNPEAAMAYSKRIIAEQEAALSRSSRSTMQSDIYNKPTSELQTNTHLESKSGKPRSNPSPVKDPNVLFDADDLSEEEEEDDDFDEFENAEEDIASQSNNIDVSKTEQQSSMPSMDLLGLGDGPQPAMNLHTNTRESTGESFTKEAPQIPTAAPSHSTKQIPPKEEDDFWDDFEISEASHTPKNPKVLSAPISSQDRGKQPKSLSNEQNVLPPTNVPPPAVLLSIFPSVFAEADEALFNTVAKLDLKQKKMLLAHPASHQFLKRYLGHCTALARIIAGRKLRWKRDQRLSQSMRIGPAAAGGKGGMKLTGLDKSEVAKEDREVLDVLRLWKSQVGKLRTAVNAASSAPAVPKLPAVPEIADQLSVKALKSVEGGLIAPQPCALCGLKREERVVKVDVEVDDSFGEWWVQGTNMHLACRNFWDEFERKLKSR